MRLRVFAIRLEEYQRSKRDYSTYRMLEKSAQEIEDQSQREGDERDLSAQ